MIVTRCLIPRVSAAALVLGGLDGCGGDGGDSGSGFERACESFRRCEPDNFAADYDSIAECTDAYEDYFGLYGANCESAYDAFFRCAANFVGSSCDLPSEAELRGACGDEYDAVVSVCD